MISIISGNCRQLSRILCNSIYAFIPWRHWVWNWVQGKVSQGRRKKCDRGARIAAWRGALIESGGRGGVCAFASCACVYSTSVHLDSIYVSWVFLNRPRAFQSFSPCQLFFFSQITLFMHVSFSPSCLHAPPYVSYSLSITFSGSPGQAVKCCNLSPSPGLYPRLPSLLRCSWITALTAAPEGGEPPDKKRVRVEVGDKDISH